MKLANRLNSILCFPLTIALVSCYNSSADSASAKSQNWRSQQAKYDSSVITVHATGVIKPKTGAEVKVGSRLSGLVEKLFVDVGDYVEKGAVLARLDDSELQAQIELIEANIDEIAAMNLYNEQKLVMAKATEFTTEDEFNLLLRDINVNRARLKQNHANLRLARIRQSYSEIISPMSGTVASVATQQGETIAASFATPTFLTIVDLSRLEIQAYVDESDIGRIKTGQTIRFTVDTYSNVDFFGTVSAIYPKAEIINNVVNYIVIIELDDQSDYQLRPEMTAHVQFYLAEHNTLMVPRTALLTESDNHFLVVRTSGQWRQRPVTLGAATATEIEITHGLDIGETYLVDQEQINSKLWRESSIDD